MTTRRALRLPMLMLGLVIASGAGADEPLPDDRARIARERAAIEATWVARERECVARFVVTSCVEDAQRARRAGLAELRRQEIVLDEAQRRERAAARLESLEKKLRQRPEPAPRVREPKAPRSAPEPADTADRSPARRAPKASPQAELRRREPVTPEDRRQGDAARAAAFAERAEAARLRREAVERRNAERATQGKHARPLPLPAGASAP